MSQHYRFAICEAYYCFASDHHRGQGSAEYALFGALERIGFRPSPLLSSDRLEDDAREIYDALASGEKRIRDRR